MTSGNKRLPTCPRLSALSRQQRRLLQRKHFVWLASVQTANSPHPDFCTLKWWANQASQQPYNLLVERSSARDRALKRCLTDRHANARLQPCPTENLGLRLIPTVLCKLQLL